MPAAKASVNALLYAARDARREKRWADVVENYEAVVEIKHDDPRLLNSYAWFLVSVEDEAHRNPARSLELSRRAAELTNGQAGYILDALAEALYQTGNLEEATERAEAAAKLDQRPLVANRAIRFRKELEEKRLQDATLEQKRPLDAAEGPAPPADGPAVREEPPRAVTTDAVEKAGDPGDPGDPAAAARASPWALLGVGLVGLACIAGVALAVRRGRKPRG